MDGLKYCNLELTTNTINYGQKQIIVDSVTPDNSYLRDCTRGGGIETYDLENSWSFEYEQPINLWDDVPGGMDAHWSTEMIYDFYLIDLD